MLKDALIKGRCIKLVCGAGNEDAIEVEKLVALYAKAGATYFDLSAKEDVVKAAYKGLSRVIPEEQRDKYYMNVSVGIKGDPHVSKARIDMDKCIKCGQCAGSCMQHAVIAGEYYFVDTKRCIGCAHCKETCPTDAVVMTSEQKDLNLVLPPLVELGIDSIELHAVSDDYNKIMEQWKIVSECFDGVLSICTDRSHASDIELIHRIKEMIKDREPYTTIVQADGAPMSGCDDEYSTTLQTVATAQIVQRADLPVFILLSGGTNSKTSELAHMCGVQATGVSLGSYARMLVREYIKQKDFLENQEIFGKALTSARELVEYCRKYL